MSLTKLSSLFQTEFRNWFINRKILFSLNPIWKTIKSTPGITEPFYTFSFLFKYIIYEKDASKSYFNSNSSILFTKVNRCSVFWISQQEACKLLSHGTSALQKKWSKTYMVEEQFAALLFQEIIWKFKKSFLSKFNYKLHLKKRTTKFVSSQKFKDTEIHMNLQYFFIFLIGLTAEVAITF